MDHLLHTMQHARSLALGELRGNGVHITFFVCWVKHYMRSENSRLWGERDQGRLPVCSRCNCVPWCSTGDHVCKGTPIVSNPAPPAFTEPTDSELWAFACSQLLTVTVAFVQSKKTWGPLDSHQPNLYGSGLGHFRDQLPSKASPLFRDGFILLEHILDTEFASSLPGTIQYWWASQRGGEVWEIRLNHIWGISGAG